MGVRLPIGAALAACLMAMPGAAALAATIEGQVVFPGQAPPPMTVYAAEVDTSRIRSQSLAAGQLHFSLEVPAGRYVVFAALRVPGEPDIYAAHTRRSLCTADASCADHALADVTLAMRASHAQLSIDDWELPDEVAAQLDRIRGIEVSDAIEPLAAPHFSEYRATVGEGLAAPHLDAGELSLSAEDRARVQQALAAGPNFAGSLSLVRLKCAGSCERLLLLDWHSGRLTEPAAIGEIRGPLPCRPDEAVLFRRDSRLVGVTSARGEALVTQYFVWKPEGATLAPLGEYPRSLQGFCAAVPP